MHEVRRQRMHAHQFAARFLVGRSRRCWRRAVKSVMEFWWPAWAGWWCSPAPGQSGPCARGDRVCTRFPNGVSYMVAWFQVEHESRRRVQDSLQWCQCRGQEDGVAVVEARQHKGRDQSRRNVSFENIFILWSVTKGAMLLVEYTRRNGNWWSFTVIAELFVVQCKPNLSAVGFPSVTRPFSRLRNPGFGV